MLILSFKVKNGDDGLRYWEPLGKVGVAQDDANLCMSWAFGPDWFNKNLEKCISFWNTHNTKHGIIPCKAEPEDFLETVGKAYHNREVSNVKAFEKLMKGVI